MADDPATPPDEAAPASTGDAAPADAASAAAEGPRRRRREAGDLTSSDDGEGAPARALTSSDATTARPKRRKRREGDALVSSSVSDDDLPAARPRTTSRRAQQPQPATAAESAQPVAAPAPAQAGGTEGEAADAQEAQDALFGLFAVKAGLVSEAQVERAIAKQRGAEGAGKPLARVLVEMGALTSAQREQVLAQIDPEVIPGYRIEGEAGRGGMGVVYKARQLSMDRVVALKILARRLSSDPSYVTKFLAEARSAGKLNHENVVAAIDAGAAAGLHYFVMEFVSGRSVAETLEREGPLPWPRAFEVAEQVARGLAHAHQAGLVHRDVKPENILLTADGRAKLCDLGLAKAAQIAGTGGKSDMTEGTPYYCSPEQALGRTDIDARSDVYSLGATLYHMLKGRPPFDGESARAILVKQVREPFPDLDVELPEVPPALRRLIRDMVKKEREQRLPSMRAFEERLVAARRAEAAAAAPGRRGGRKGSLALVAAVFGVFTGVGAVAALSLGPATAQPDVVAVGEAPPATEAPATETPPATEAAPPRQPTRPTRVTRVTDPPDEAPAPRATEAAAPASDAARALAEARRFAAARAGDPAVGRDALLAVAERFPDTPEAEAARREAAALTKAVFDAGFKRFEALTNETIALVRDGAYRAAAEAIDAFAVEWEPRQLPGMADQLASLRRVVEQQAQQRLDDAVKRLEAAKAPEELAAAQAALDDLLQRVPARVADAARPRVEALARDRARREAEAAAQAAIARRDQALARGDRAAAAAALEAALADPALDAAARSSLVRAQEELAELSRAWDAFDATARRLGDEERGRYRLREGAQLRGRLLDYDPAGWRGRVKVYGQHEEVPLDLRDLHPEDLLAMALPPAEGRANVLFFIARGAPEVAALAYAAWIGAGAQDDPELQARVERALAASLEERVARQLDAALAPDAPAEVVLAALPLCEDVRARATGAYRERYERLKEAVKRARAAQLAAAPQLLFKGAFEVARRGDVVTLRYDFKDPAQLQDWTPDTGVDKDSGARKGDDGMIVKGKLSHVARFQGGELGVELKATTSNGRRPNLNVILGDQGGWTGVLLGLGFVYGAMNDIRVDPTAPRKPGYTVPLPANVCVVLDGRRPRVDGPNFAAETSPSVQGTQGRAHKLDAIRAADGALRLRLRGRDVYRLPALGKWDEPGTVALAPFGTEIVVHEVEIVGRLDAAWVTARAESVAAAEAAALPPPTPAPAPAAGGETRR